MPSLSDVYRIIVDFGNFLEAHNGAISAVSTVFVAAFTYTLYRATRRLWRTAQDQSQHLERSVKAAENSAKAAISQARIAERSLIDLERPYLFITAVNPIMNTVRTALPQGTVVDLPTEFTVNFAFHNWGRTPATTKEINFRLAYVSEISAISAYGDNIRRGEVIIGQNMSTDPYTESYKFTADGKQRFIGGTEDRQFFFYGYIIYSDVFGNTYRRGHGMQYFRRPNSFMVVGGEAFNYDRREENALKQ